MIFRPPRFLSAILATLLALHASVKAAGDSQRPRPQRPRIGVALGGGSARGLAHVGVIRWFEEHRIPIDLIAGTSMGGLMGGAFASGMSAAELTRLLEETNWDEMFGSLPFRYKNIRRKEDARAYPSRIEFGLKQGFSPPVALNNGQQVEFMLARMTGAYVGLSHFDELPTPFRCMAVDLVTAQPVVLQRGSLAAAMRATMSLPGVFPPVEIDGQVLVDGGAMNNVPADVVRAMGADVVIAVNVGFMGEKRPVSYSMLGLMGNTVDVMMQASTRAAMKSADIIINPQLEEFGSLDWRRSAALAEEGYRAAEALKDKLLPLAVSAEEWNTYLEARKAKRRSTLPAPSFLSIVGATKRDEERIERVLRSRIGQPIDVDGLELDLETFAGLDRYDTVGWQLVEKDGRYGLQVQARPKAHAPPFLMLGVSLQNTTTDDFAFQLSARYLTFDVLGSGSELRVDGALGASPRFGAELYRPIGRSPLFVAGHALTARRSINFVQDDSVVARYNEVRHLVGLDVGTNLGRDSEIRLGIDVGLLHAYVVAGDPALPELDGQETRARLRWIYDTQDSPVVPSRGTRLQATISHVIDSPDLPAGFPTDRSNDRVTQAEGGVSRLWSVRAKRDRVLGFAAAGTSFSDHPLATEQFTLGVPLRLAAYDIGELRGDHYGVLTVGYLRGIARLPDFLGGSLFVGGWIENGTVFDDLDDAELKTNASLGAIADTIAGPLVLGTSVGFDGRWRYYVAIGRIF
jgi:NTE family protein